MRTMNNPVLRQEFVSGAFKPGAQLATFTFTIGSDKPSADEVSVYGYAATGVTFAEPEMDTTRVVPEVLQESVEFVTELLGLLRGSRWDSSRTVIGRHHPVIDSVAVLQGRRNGGLPNRVCEHGASPPTHHSGRDGNRCEPSYETLVGR